MPFLAICPRNFSKEPAMDDGTPPNVVHEAEAQRQHPRVRVPGIIHVAQSGGEHRYALHDLSAGGLSFVVTDGARFKIGDTYRARLSFTVAPVAFVLPLSFQVRNLGGAGKRVGVVFQNPGARENAVLRQVTGGIGRAAGREKGGKYG